MKSFNEFITKTETETNPTEQTVFPTFEEATGAEGKTCVSEGMKKMIKEMCEAGMAEMKACHEDETEMTAESWMAECGTYMTECMESLKDCCDNCIKQG